MSSFSSSLFALILMHFLSAGSAHTFSRSRKKVAALTLPTIHLYLLLVFCLRSLKLSSTLISWIIWSLILFSQIISIDFDSRGQLVTNFTILLIYDLLTLGTSESLVWWSFTYQRLLTGYGMLRCSPSFLPLDFFLLLSSFLRSFYFDT